MDFTVYRKKSDLDSTAFFEIGPGRCSGDHWQDGFLFISEDAFAFAEGVLAKHIAKYDHYAVNEVAREDGLKVVSDWRAISGRLAGLGPDEAAGALNLKSAFRSGPS